MRVAAVTGLLLSACLALVLVAGVFQSFLPVAVGSTNDTTTVMGEANTNVKQIPRKLSKDERVKSHESIDNDELQVRFA